MSSFLSLFSQILGYLYNMLSDSRIASLFGPNLFWILFAFFCCWSGLNVAVFRASVSPGSVSRGLNYFNKRGDGDSNE